MLSELMGFFLDDSSISSIMNCRKDFSYGHYYKTVAQASPKEFIWVLKAYSQANKEAIYFLDD